MLFIVWKGLCSWIKTTKKTLKDYGGMWNELNLSAEQLESLGLFLDEKLNVDDCDHSLSQNK